MATSIFQTFCDCIKSIFILPAQHKKIFFIIVLLLLFYATTGKDTKDKDNHFDYFVFSQRWLPTSCIVYIEHDSSSHKYCSLPQNYEFWAIHGLWPTQENHLGPFFCNLSIPFNLDKLSYIESELKQNWPNIEGGKGESSLWQHEWDKHGTCSVQLESLNSELKYFNTTLNFFKIYNIQAVFKRNNIIPDLKDGISVTDLFYLIKNEWGKVPSIHCIKEVKSSEPYLSEIHLCFNKNLELMDCRHKHKYKFYSNEDVSEVLTDCPLNRKVIIPDKVDDKIMFGNSQDVDTLHTLTDILQIIQFLQWVSI